MYLMPVAAAGTGGCACRPTAPASSADAAIAALSRKRVVISDLVAQFVTFDDAAGIPPTGRARGCSISLFWTQSAAQRSRRMSQLDGFNRRAFLRTTGMTALAGAVGSGTSFAGVARAATGAVAPGGVIAPGDGKFDFDTPYSRLGTD